jgi:predicted secreted protein
MNKSSKFYYWLGALLILVSTRPAVAIDTVPLSEEGGTTPPPAATSSSPVVWEITVREGGAWQAEGNATIAPQGNAGGSLRAGDQLASLAEQLRRAGLFAHGPVVQFEIAGRVESSQSFTLTLPCNPSTGYIWQPSLAADTPLRVSQTPVSIISQSNLRGAPAFCVFEVQATAEGMGRLAMMHRRPWLPDAPVQAIVRVQAAAAGPGLDELAGALSWPVIVQPAQLPQHEPTPASTETTTNDPPSDGQSVQALPSRFNWCEHGVCPPARDQGQCGSCWAFSGVGVMDIVARIARPGAQPDFSEQFLVSCNYRGWGCNGGWIALDMFVDRRVWHQPMAGPVAERFFPYAAQDLPCGGPYPQSWQGRAWGYAGPSNGIPTPDQIKQAVYRYGPLDVAVYAGYAFGYYTGGVFQTNEAPSERAINHGVVLVGWDDAGGYWIIRNSWGPYWGEHWSGQRRNGDNGYMRIKYGISNIGYAAAYLDGARLFNRRAFFPMVRERTGDNGMYPVPNGDFEALGPWVIQGGGNYIEWARSGRYAAALWSSLRSSTSVIRQAVTVPPQASTLRYWYYLCPAPGSTRVRLGNAVLKTYSAPSGSWCTGWQQETLNIQSYRGQRLELAFEFTKSGDSNWVAFSVDDVVFMR